MTTAKKVAEMSMNAYIILVVVEFFALGHAEQHNEHAALPKQQAAWNNFISLRLIDVSLTDAAQNGAARSAPIENQYNELVTELSEILKTKTRVLFDGAHLHY